VFASAFNLPIQHNTLLLIEAQPSQYRKNGYLHYRLLHGQSP
jgi:hypothetical protein